MDSFLTGSSEAPTSSRGLVAIGNNSEVGVVESWSFAVGVSYLRVRASP